MGLADLADSPQEEWTDAAFEQIVATHPDSGVRVLTWGTDPAESERISVDLLLAALRWARDHHSYVIVDNHPGYADRTMAMLAVSSEIFLVVTPEVGALRNSTQFLDLARELGFGNVVRVIVNRANHGIRPQDMAKTLGLPISATIVSNGPKAVISSNEGRPDRPQVPAREDVRRSPCCRPARLAPGADGDRPDLRARQARVVDPLRDPHLRGLTPRQSPGGERHRLLCHYSAAVPTYDYQCRSCGSVTEVIHSMLEEGPALCEQCGGDLRRVLYPTGIIFKGSGFYRTDSRRSGSTSSESKPSEPKPSRRRHGGEARTRSRRPRARRGRRVRATPGA